MKATPTTEADLAAHWGALVRARREGLDLQRTELAVRLGCSVQAVWLIEAGRRPPRDAVKVALAEALETTLADLFPWPDEVVA